MQHEQVDFENEQERDLWIDVVQKLAANPVYIDPGQIALVADKFVEAYRVRDALLRHGVATFDKRAI